MNKIIYSFKPHSSKYGSKILRKYRMDEVIDFNSESNIPLLKELNDDDRWLIASENRPYLMNWFVCTPK